MKMNQQHKIFYGALTLLALMMAVPVFGQNAKKMVRKGNKLFDKEKYSDAEVQYRKALEKHPKYEKGTFNLGEALYKEKNYDEAGKHFLDISKKSKSDNLKAKSWYNLGNVLMQKKQYEKSIQSYINSLRINPNDYNAKYNLEYARKKLKQQQQKNKQNKNNKDKKKNKDKNKKNQDKKNKNDKNKDKKKDQNKKNDQNNKNKQNKNNQNKQNKNKNQQNKGGKQNQRPKMSKADAQRMLDALRNNEKNTLKKLEKKKAKQSKANPMSSTGNGF